MNMRFIVHVSSEDNLLVLGCTKLIQYSAEWLNSFSLLHPVSSERPHLTFDATDKMPMQLSESDWQSVLESHKGEINKSHKEMLLDHNVDLVNTLDIKSTLPALVNEGIVSREQEQVILRKPSPQDGVRELMRLMNKKGEQGFLCFCKAVVQNPNTEAGMHL